MVKFLSILRYFVGGIGIASGFYYLASSSPEEALKVVSLATVGIVGVISFFTHVVFQKEDAKRLGWPTDHPEWQFEVGFANMAFGISAIIVYFGEWDIAASTILILAYALYLLQAAILHSAYSFRDGKKDIGHFIRSGIVTFLYSGMMLYFAIMGIINL